MKTEAKAIAALDLLRRDILFFTDIPSAVLPISFPLQPTPIIGSNMVAGRKYRTF